MILSLEHMMEKNPNEAEDDKYIAEF